MNNIFLKLLLIFSFCVTGFLICKFFFESGLSLGDTVILLLAIFNTVLITKQIKK